MAYLALIFITIALVVSFVALVEYEMRRNVRFAAVQRAELDARIERISFVLVHVDFVAFIRDEVQHFTSRAGHAIVEHSLHAVRAIERFLTRVVRSLRTRHSEEEGPRETAREFVKQLSEFKGQLSAPPEMPEL